MNKNINTFEGDFFHNNELEVLKNNKNTNLQSTQNPSQFPNQVLPHTKRSLFLTQTNDNFNLLTDSGKCKINNQNNQKNVLKTYSYSSRSSNNLSQNISSQ